MTVNLTRQHLGIPPQQNQSPVGTSWIYENLEKHLGLYADLGCAQYQSYDPNPYL